MVEDYRLYIERMTEALDTLRATLMRNNMDDLAAALDNLPSVYDLPEPAVEETELEERLSTPVSLINRPTPLISEEVLPLQRNVEALRLFKITAVAENTAADNGPNSTITEWTYGASIVKPSINANGAVYTVDDNIDIETVYNGIEEINTTIITGGTFGNGAAWDELDTDVWTGQLQPLQVGTVMLGYLFRSDYTGEMLNYGIVGVANGVKGECD